MTDILSTEYEAAKATPPAGTFERITQWLNLFPMVAQCLWPGLRHGSLTLQ